MEAELLGAEYRNGLELLRRKRHTEAAEIFKRLSTSHVGARAYYAWLLERGLGCTKDNSEARRLYQSAAEGGSRIAQFFLGCMHWRLRGGTECVHWFERAAAQGYAGADYCLNRVYRTGTIAARNKEKARLHLGRAAALGHLYALRDIQYYSFLGEYGAVALLCAPFRVVPALFAVMRAILANPSDPRLARFKLVIGHPLAPMEAEAIEALAAAERA
jgi:TPR repeat protein